MLAAGDAVADVVEQRGRTLANAAGVIAVPAAARRTRNEGGADQSLRVDDRVIRPPAQSAPEFSDFAPG
jgi:hypothetical protein